MALKKSELYFSLWSSCDELRGGMDASQYKDYVLVLLFVKYVSDKYAAQPFAPITIPPGASFKDMVALKGKSDIGDQINKKILGPLANANNLSDMPDFNDDTKLGSGKEKVDRLTNLIAIFENPSLDFSKNRADGDDILGDAYEYLMRHFATESGKSKGQFYTPAEVSRVIAQILGIRSALTTNNTTVYDPTCGSGSLLLKVGDEASHNRDVRVTLYGQEKDAATAGLARMNMILHNNPTALIKQGNTLTNPLFTDASGQLKTFDYVIANPPFSDKRWSTGLDPANDPFDRFKHYGVPPAKQGDYAYLLHILHSLKSTGKGACILPHGVLFRGNAEAVIRKNLVQRGYVKAVIGLPVNLFYGTSIPACIIVLDKDNAAIRKGIFMIDASKGFSKDGNKNRLRAQDMHKIVDTYARQTEIPRYSRMVSVAEISDPKNDFNLNLPRYIDSTEPEDIQDIDGHLRGGIPDRDIDALERYWQVIPDVRGTLFKKADRAGYSQLKVPAADIRTTIFGHGEFTTYNASVIELFAKWKAANTPRLKGVAQGSKPKALIETLAEDLLGTFEQARLLDAYDVYQHLMDYWAATMQDDCYLITSDGWKAEPTRVLVTNKKGEELDKGWICELVPKPFLLNRYFTAEQDAIRQKEAELEGLTDRLTELEEEHGGEDGALNLVSTKDDAQQAQQDALLLAWHSSDAPTYSRYTAALTQQESLRQQLVEREADPRIAALANAKGKITQTTVNASLRREKDAGTLALLQVYKTTVSALKEAKNTTEELREAAVSTIQLRLKAEPDNEDLGDLRVLSDYLIVTDQISNAKKAVKEAGEELDALLYAKYATLTEDEIKTLVVDDKWMATLATALQSELDRVSQTLTGRVRELAQRYATPLPQLTSEVAKLAAHVNEHLKRMGAVWK